MEYADCRISINVMRDSDNQELTITVPEDGTVRDVTDAFRAILTWLTYSPETINEALPDGEEYSENQN